MPASSSRAFGFSSSSASSRHANRARPASDDEGYSDDAPNDSYRHSKKGTNTLKSSAVKSSSSVPSSRSKRAAEDIEEDFAHIRPVKKAAPASSHELSSSSRARTDDDVVHSDVDQDALGFSDELLLERKAYDEWVDKKLSKLSSKREQLLEERIERIRAERDEIQSQYDELRRLRNTAPEEALEDFKKASESRFRHDKDLINSLKVKVEAAEKRAKEEGGAGGDRSMSILASARQSLAPESPNKKVEELKQQHKKELAEATRAQKRLEEDVKALQSQLEQEIKQSKALLSAASGSTNGAGRSTARGATESTAASASLAAMEDEKSVRKLYEDLTGLVITAVERIDPSAPFRRFKAIFAQEDYYSILMDLEESQSKVGGASKMRDDIVYVPKVEEDRDGELLRSKMVPQEWLEALRFDRNMLFKWYEKTRKALLTDEARARLRAREERSRH